MLSNTILILVPTSACRFPRNWVIANCRVCQSCMIYWWDGSPLFVNSPNTIHIQRMPSILFREIDVPITLILLSFDNVLVAWGSKHVSLSVLVVDQISDGWDNILSSLNPIQLLFWPKKSLAGSIVLVTSIVHVVRIQWLSTELTLLPSLLLPYWNIRSDQDQQNWRIIHTSKGSVSMKLIARFYFFDVDGYIRWIYLMVAHGFQTSIKGIQFTMELVYRTRSCVPIARFNVM